MTRGHTGWLPLLQIHGAAALAQQRLNADLLGKGHEQEIVLNTFPLDTSTSRYEVWVDGQAKGWAQIDSNNVSVLPWAG